MTITWYRANRICSLEERLAEAEAQLEQTRVDAQTLMEKRNNIRRRINTRDNRTYVVNLPPLEITITHPRFFEGAVERAIEGLIYTNDEIDVDKVQKYMTLKEE